jgi:hypothetical protein
VRLLDGQRFDVGFTIGLAQPRTLTSFWHRPVYLLSDSPYMVYRDVKVIILDVKVILAPPGISR